MPNNVPNKFATISKKSKALENVVLSCKTSIKIPMPKDNKPMKAIDFEFWFFLCRLL